MYEQKCHKHNTGGDYSVHLVQGNLHLENYFQLGNTLQKKRKAMWGVSQGHNKEADVIQEEILKEGVSLVWGRKRLFCFVCFIIKKRGAVCGGGRTRHLRYMITIKGAVINSAS